MTSTDKVIEILTFLKEKLQISDEDLNAVGAKLGELQAMASNEVASSYTDPAGAEEIQAFAQAATSLLVLDEEMRQRVLDALQQLMLPREPTFLEKLAPAIAPALAAAIAQAQAVPNAKQEIEDAKKELEELASVFDAPTGGLSLKDGTSLVQDPDGSLWVVSGKHGVPHTRVKLVPE